jgi:hypothetical protein
MAERNLMKLLLSMVEGLNRAEVSSGRAINGDHLTLFWQVE